MSLPSEPLRSTTTAQMAAVRLKHANKYIFRAVLSLASAALLVRVFGMLNQIAVTRRFGAGAAMDAYFVASALPILMATMLSTSVEGAIIPVYAEVRTRGREQASILFSTLLNLLLPGTAALTLLMFTFRNQLIHLSAPALDPLRTAIAVQLAPFIIPVLLLMVMVSFLECILNAEGQFGWPAYAGLLVPLTTAIFVLTLSNSEGVVILCAGMLAGLCLQLCVVLVRARRAGIVYRFSMKLRTPEIRAIMMVAWIAPFSILFSQISPLVDQMFASYLSAGSISALNYSLKLVSVFTGVIFVSVGRAALPYLSRQAAKNDMKAFKETLRFYLWVVGIGTIALAALMLVLAHPLVQILFQRGAFSARDTDRTASTFMGFVVGLAPMALGFILARSFIALRKNSLLLVTTLFGVIANIVFDYFFARLWQGTGIALATSTVYFANLCILLFMLRRVIGKLDILTLPPEFLRAMRKLDTGFQFSIPYSLRRRIVRGGIILMIFVGGVVGVFWNSLYSLRAAFGSLVLLAFLRYRYALLISWAIINVFIGSTLSFFNGNNIDTALTLPTLLLLACMPIKQTFQRMPALTILLLYIVWALVGIGISPLGIGPFLTQWTLMLNFVAISILTIHVLTTRQHLLRLIDAILIPAAFVSLYGIYGYFTRQNGVVDPTTSLFRIYSIEGAAPSLALFLSIVIPPAIYRASTLYGFKRLGVSILVLIFLVAMGLTFSRSAIICIPLSVITMILFLPSRKMKIGLLGASLGLAVGVALLATIGNVSIFSRFFNQDIATLNGRTYLWQAIFDRVDPTQLLGHGLGSGKLLLDTLGYGSKIASSPSNLFIAALYEHGIIGLALLTLVFIALGVGLIVGMRKTTGDRRVLFVMALVAFVNMAIQSFEQNDFWAQSIGIYFWIIMALPFALCWSTAKQSSRPGEEALDEATEARLEAAQLAKHELVARL